MSGMTSRLRAGWALFFGGLTIILASCGVHAGTVTYTYDTVGRLATANYAADSLCINYSYDAAGNRTQFASTNPGPPVGVNDAVSTNENVPVTFDPRANDTSPSCYPLTITAVTTPGHGSATIGNSGTAITYGSVTNFAGSDSFGYTVSDGHGGTASPTISVTVVATLSASIGPGVDANGRSGSHIFPSNTVTVVGGSGSYTYSWLETDDGNGIWTHGGTGVTFGPVVSGVGVGGEASTAQYTCTVTDTIYHISATSNFASYRWQNITP